MTRSTQLFDPTRGNAECHKQTNKRNAVRGRIKIKIKTSTARGKQGIPVSSVLPSIIDACGEYYPICHFKVFNDQKATYCALIIHGSVGYLLTYLPEVSTCLYLRVGHITDRLMLHLSELPLPLPLRAPGYTQH